MVTAEEAGKRWVGKSVQAYLEGEKDLRWIAGILRGLSKEEIQAVLDSFGQSGLPERREAMNDWLNQGAKSGI